MALTPRRCPGIGARFLAGDVRPAPRVAGDIDPAVQVRRLIFETRLLEVDAHDADADRVEGDIDAEAVEQVRSPSARDTLEIILRLAVVEAAIGYSRLRQVEQLVLGNRGHVTSSRIGASSIGDGGGPIVPRTHVLSLTGVVWSTGAAFSGEGPQYLWRRT